MKKENLIRALRGPRAFLQMRRHLLGKRRAAAIGFQHYFLEQMERSFPLERATFKLIQGYDLDLTNPKTFNECLVHRRLYSRDDTWVRVTDKVEVRQHVRQTTDISDDILIEVLDVVDDPNALRGRFFDCDCVIKAAWASGRNIFLKKGRTLSDDEIEKMLLWRSEPYNVHSLIWASHQIPRRFIIEHMLKGENGGPPRDYKFFVFNGEVLMIQVDRDRFRRHRRDLYDAKGRLLPVGLAYKRSEMPDFLLDSMRVGAMTEVAAELGKQFDFARIDLYWVDGGVFLGEITQTPGRGHERFTELSFDQMLGAAWKYNSAAVEFDIKQSHFTK